MAGHSGEFLLGDWLVQPMLDRVSRAGEVHHLEPKVMDVLVLLAANAGTVVSRDEILEAVWVRKFVSDSTISRAIAAIRQALGDRPESPQYIETITKRGYRLLRKVSWSADKKPRAAIREFARNVAGWLVRHMGEEVGASPPSWSAGASRSTRS